MESATGLGFCSEPKNIWHVAPRTVIIAGYHPVTTGQSLSSWFKSLCGFIMVPVVVFYMISRYVPQKKLFFFLKLATVRLFILAEQLLWVKGI